MVNFRRSVGAATFVFAALGSAHAQSVTAADEQIRARQPIITMEAALEQSIEVGAQNVILEVRRVIREYSPRIAKARASGVRLPNYGILFTVDVPQMPLPFLYDVMLLDLQTRNAMLQIQRLRNEASALPPAEGAARLNQANQIEQQLVLGNFRATQPTRGTVAASSIRAVGVEIPGVEPSVVDDPVAAYTSEVKKALIDAMLNASQPLGLKADELLTVVARDGTPANPQSPGDRIDNTTYLMQVKGSVLAAFRAGSMTIEEARKQVEVKEQ